MTEAHAIGPLNDAERAFAARAVRRKRVFRTLAIAGVVIAAGLALFYGWARLHDPSFPLGARIALIVLILLNARQNLRQYKYAAVLEKLTRA
ncbi:MAG: hypothetical protein IT293_08270 [Deltaproteobacteria bacterium]|nr:hypothetical protein [Deltaproteobacteria bacterium]